MGVGMLGLNLLNAEGPVVGTFGGVGSYQATEDPSISRFSTSYELAVPTTFLLLAKHRVIEIAFWRMASIWGAGHIGCGVHGVKVNQFGFRVYL